MSEKTPREHKCAYTRDQVCAFTRGCIEHASPRLPLQRSFVSSRCSGRKTFCPGICDGLIAGARTGQAQSRLSITRQEPSCGICLRRASALADAAGPGRKERTSAGQAHCGCRCRLWNGSRQARPEMETADRIGSSRSRSAERGRAKGFCRLVRHVRRDRHWPIPSPPQSQSTKR
jgi:hypothetical protein